MITDEILGALRAYSQPDERKATYRPSSFVTTVPMRYLLLDLDLGVWARFARWRRRQRQLRARVRRAKRGHR